jgi:hypothetical protein
MTGSQFNKLLPIFLLLFLGISFVLVFQKLSFPQGITRPRAAVANAVFALVPENGGVPLNETIDVNLAVNTQGQPIVAVTAEITYAYTGVTPGVSVTEVMEKKMSNDWTTPVATVTENNGQGIIEISTLYIKADSNGYTPNGTVPFATLRLRGNVLNGSINLNLNTNGNNRIKMKDGTDIWNRAGFTSAFTVASSPTIIPQLPAVTLEMGNVTVTGGQTAQIPVYASSQNAQLGGMQFIVDLGSQVSRVSSPSFQAGSSPFSFNSWQITPPFFEGSQLRWGLFNLTGSRYQGSRVQIGTLSLNTSAVTVVQNVPLNLLGAAEVSGGYFTDAYVVDANGNELSKTLNLIDGTLNINPSGSVNPTPTNTPVPTNTPTTAPATTRLNIKVKFQGVRPLVGADLPRQTILVKVTSVTNSSTIYEQRNLVMTHTGNDTDGIAVYSGIMDNLVIPSDITTYNVLIKGPAHLQKKITNVTIRSGQITNLEPVILLAGDLVDDYNAAGQVMINRLTVEDIVEILSQYTSDGLPVSSIPAIRQKVDINLDRLLRIEDIMTVLGNYNRLVVVGDN